MGFLADKRILITGVLSKHSIAYGIAKACHREGAKLAFTYQNERFLDRINKFAAEFDSTLVYQCDVAEDAQIDKLFADLATQWEGLDGLVHSIAYAPTEAIEGDFLDGITRESFRIAHDISSYSYPALAKAARPLLLKGNNAALLALYLSGCRTHHAELQHHGTGQGQSRSRHALPGLLPWPARHTRQRAFCRTDQDAGCVRYRQFRQAAGLQFSPRPLRRNVTIDEVGNACASCFPTWPVRSPAKSCTSMAA